jgi:hypothetical protein
VINLPKFEEVEKKYNNDCESLDPLEQFIYDNEPADDDGGQGWRINLTDAIMCAHIEYL